MPLSGRLRGERGLSGCRLLLRSPLPVDSEGVGKAPLLLLTLPYGASLQVLSAWQRGGSFSLPLIFCATSPTASGPLRCAVRLMAGESRAFSPTWVAAPHAALSTCHQTDGRWHGAILGLSASQVAPLISRGAVRLMARGSVGD